MADVLDSLLPGMVKAMVDEQIAPLRQGLFGADDVTLRPLNQGLIKMVEVQGQQLQRIERDSTRAERMNKIIIALIGALTVVGGALVAGVP
jgi:hypothetical protein